MRSFLNCVVLSAQLLGSLVLSSCIRHACSAAAWCCLPVRLPRVCASACGYSLAPGDGGKILRAAPTRLGHDCSAVTYVAAILSNA